MVFVSFPDAGLHAGRSGVRKMEKPA